MICVKWCEMWNTTWNDMKCDMKWYEMQHEMTWHTWNAIHWFRLRATRCNLDSFDFDHNLIILFLISLRIWASVLMWNWLNKISKICVYSDVTHHPKDLSDGIRVYEILLEDNEDVAVDADFWHPVESILHQHRYPNS